jgi:hypothetical protein
MTTINRATPETPETKVIERVLEAARVYAFVRDRVDHVNSRGARRCTDDAGRLFDALALAEAHLLCAVKHLPAQCLPDDDGEAIHTLS